MPEILIKNKNFRYNTDPDKCPICHRSIKPELLCSSNYENGAVSILQNVYKCPDSGCHQVFIGTYTKSFDLGPSGLGRQHELHQTAPFKPQSSDIPKEVDEISPNYRILFNQSEAAEKYRLDQIAGAGYRKSLEFLIKDYAILNFPNAKEEIKDIFLGKVIDTYISDENIKQCAKRAAWLGNDETHYIRKWDEKDINDLKALIKLTQAWIYTNLLTKKYLETMPK